MMVDNGQFCATIDIRSSAKVTGRGALFFQPASSKLNGFCLKPRVALRHSPALILADDAGWCQ